MEGALSHTV